MTTLPAPKPEASSVGFNQAPSFFRANTSMLEAGPAKVAERSAHESRAKDFNNAVRFHREAIDALFRFKALDATGQLVAGMEHYEVHVNRSEDAADTLLASADAFAKAWKL